jgi:hypothetical protein
MEIGLMVAKFIPWFMYAAMLILGLALVAGLGYYLFIVKRRKKWKVTIWERKVNGRVYKVGFDWLIAKKFNKGKQVMYLLRKAKAECIPPPEDCVDYVRGNEETNYLRVLDEYRPMNRTIQLPEDFLDFNEDKVTGQKKSKLIIRIKESLETIKRLSTSETESKFVFIPLDKAIVGNINFKPMDYDVNMMRINALDNRDKIYKDSADWISKYGQLIAIGGIIVLIIVVLYLSFDFVTVVIDKGLGAADKVAEPLNSLVSKLSGN